MNYSVTLPAGILLVTSVACTPSPDGGTASDSTNSTSLPTPSSVLSPGAITGLGSVIVNGVEYATEKASFIVHGQPASQKELKLGMVVTVYGSKASSGTKSATTIIQEDLVEGTIQSIPATNDRIVVL